MNARRMGALMAPRSEVPRLAYMRLRGYLYYAGLLRLPLKTNAIRKCVESVAAATGPRTELGAAARLWLAREPKSLVRAIRRAETLPLN